MIPVIRISVIRELKCRRYSQTNTVTICDKYSYICIDPSPTNGRATNCRKNIIQKILRTVRVIGETAKVVEFMF